MGARIICPECDFQDRYSSSEIVNTGTSFVRKWAVYCHNCNSLINSEEVIEHLKSRYLFTKKSKSELIIEISTLINQKKLPEIILQEYLKKEFKYYGFSEIEGPFNKGPDFKIYIEGKYRWLEVETDVPNYKKHGHHLSKNFDKVEILFHLYDYDENNNFNHLFPQKHMKANANHFRDWFLEKIDKKYFVQNIIDRCNSIYNEYLKIFLNEFCDKRNESMAICPDCASCAYRNEEWIMDSTSKFLKIYSEILHSEKFDFNEITSRRLHEIFY